MTKHARLSPSAAERWMNCTASAKPTNRKDEEDVQTTSAQEGTLAHKIGEAILNDDIERLEEYKNRPEFHVDMLKYVKKYTDYCINTYNKMRKKTKNIGLRIEKRVNLDDYIPKGYGTADCIIYTDAYLEVIDLKYGIGVKVDVEDNTQLKLYALGALTKLNALGCKIKTIKLTICQVRFDDGISSFILDAEDLKRWGVEEVMPKAKEAYYEDGIYNAGDWCQFCNYKNICGYRSRLVINEAIDKLKTTNEFLDNDDIAALLDAKEILTPLFRNVENEARKRLENGEYIEGYKLRNSSRRRKFNNEEKMARDFEKAGYKDIYRLKTIKDLEKIMGKDRFDKITAPYTEWVSTTRGVIKEK